MRKDSLIVNGSVITADTIGQFHATTDPENGSKNEIYHFLKDWFSDSLEIISHTSGSTGQPKEIRLSKAAMENSARMTNAFFGLDASKTALLCLPASYIAGKMMLVRALVGGFNLLTVEPKANPFTALHEPIDFAAITPYQLHHSLETLREKRIQHIIVGGGHVSSKLEALVADLPISFYETYGMTETCSHIALRCFNGAAKSPFFEVLRGVTIRQDERDCLVINAPHLHPTEIYINDVVELQDERHFRWLGRRDRVINSGGVKIHPEQVEKKLEEIIPCPYFISSVPDEKLENKVVLVIESEKYDTEQLLALKSALTQRLSRFEVPKEIIFASAFVRSSGNKVLQKETLEKIIKN